MFLVGLLIYTLIVLCPLILKHKHYFFCQTKGFVALIVIKINVCISLYYMMEVVKIYIITLVLMMISVWISFIQMHQAVSLVKRANKETMVQTQIRKNQNIKSSFKEEKVCYNMHKFFEFHTKVFISICKMNTVFGNILLKVIICNCKYLLILKN